MREQMETRWKLADIAKFLKNSALAILKGEFLMRLNAGRYFIHIAFTFVLITTVIATSLMIETTMTKVEKNRKILQELSIENTQKRFDLMSLQRRGKVERMLNDMGSKVQEPKKNEITIED